jgi:putative phosphoribosyl transferase
MINRPPIFVDRRDAGHQLAEALRRFAVHDPVVLGLPRGGVPVAYEVADELGAPLDVVFVRKIGAPGHPELGLGAVVDGAEPQIVINEEVAALIEPPPGYIEQAVQRELEEIGRRRRVYLGEREPVPVRDRLVLVVDDGIATGGTVRAALQGLKTAGARRRVLAVPVGPPDVVRAMREACEEIVCLVTPEPFIAVGLWYRDFTQTLDAEVVALLARAERRAARRRTVEGGRRTGQAPSTEPRP